MKTFTVYGYSDDLIEFDGDIDEEYDLPSGRDVATFTLKMPDGSGVRLYVRYESLGEGCWSVGMSPLDEEKPIRSDVGWLFIFLPPNGDHDAPTYSAALSVQCPDEAKFEFEQAEG